MMIKNSSFLVVVLMLIICSCGSKAGRQKQTTNDEKPAYKPEFQLMGNRFFTLSTVVRVNQIEASRDLNVGEDESSIHGPAEARIFRETIEKAWPGARITWAFSWLALKD